MAVHEPVDRPPWPSNSSRSTARLRRALKAGGRLLELIGRSASQPGWWPAQGRRPPRLASGRGFAVLDDIGSGAAGAHIVVSPGWEGWRTGERVVTVDEVIAGAAADGVAAEVAEQGVVVRPTGDHVVERATERLVVTGTGGDRVHAAKADELVGAHPAVHRVVAAQAGQEIVTLPAAERVV